MSTTSHRAILFKDIHIPDEVLAQLQQSLLHDKSRGHTHGKSESEKLRARLADRRACAGGSTGKMRLHPKSVEMVSLAFQSEKSARSAKTIQSQSHGFWSEFSDRKRLYGTNDRNIPVRRWHLSGRMHRRRSAEILRKCKLVLLLRSTRPKYSWITTKNP